MENERTSATAWIAQNWFSFFTFVVAILWPPIFVFGVLPGAVYNFPDGLLYYDVWEWAMALGTCFLPGIICVPVWLTERREAKRIQKLLKGD